MAEEHSQQPPITVNVFNSNESQDNADTSGPNANSELVSAIASEIPGVLPAVAELVEQDTAPTEPPGSNGSVQSGDATEPGSTPGSTESDDPTIEVARINAERDVAIAAIEADVIRDTALGNVDEEIVEETNKELEECKSRIANLETEIAELRNSLIPPMQSEEPPTEQVAIAGDNSEIVQETNSTPEFTPVQTAEIGTELSDVKEDVEADLRKIKPRFIPL